MCCGAPGGFNPRGPCGLSRAGWHRCHHRAGGSKELMGKLRHGQGMEPLGSSTGHWGACGPSDALAAFQVVVAKSNVARA